MTDKAATSLFSGTPLDACPRCGGLVTVRYCARCGRQQAQDPESRWFQVQMDSSSRRTAGESRALGRYPGPVEKVGSRITVTVERAAHIDWLRERAPRLLALKNTLILVPGGRTIAPSDPVFACLLGVMESGIRGCMTQKARVAHCNAESTLLPLIEPMRASSLAEQLVNMGRSDLAEALVLGVLARLHRAGEKAYCPLFGRALRPGAVDQEKLPFQLARVLLRAGEAPEVFDLFAKGSVPVVDARLEPGKADARTALTLTMRQRATAVHPRARGGYESVRSRGPALVFRYVTDLDQRMVDFMVADESGGLDDRLSLQADDVDLFADGLASLRVEGNALTVSEFTAGSEDHLAYLAGGLTGDAWQICRWQAGYYWLWSDAGAAALLGPDRGWLLSAVDGMARGTQPTPVPTEYNGVIGVARLGDHLAVLSAGGHRLTVLALARSGVALGEPPLKRVSELLLQQPARGICGAGEDQLLLADEHLVYALKPTQDALTLYGPVEPGAKVLLLAGRAVFEQGKEAAVLGPGRKPAPLLWDDARDLIKRAVNRPTGLTEFTITDRQGRPPHRSTWGG